MNVWADHYSILYVCPNVDVWFLTYSYNSAIFFYLEEILFTRPLRVEHQKYSFWAKTGPNMRVAARRAPVGCWVPRPPQKLGHGLLGNLFLGNKFNKKSWWIPLII